MRRAAGHLVRRHRPSVERGHVQHERLHGPERRQLQPDLLEHGVRELDLAVGEPLGCDPAVLGIADLASHAHPVPARGSSHGIRSRSARASSRLATVATTNTDASAVTKPVTRHAGSRRSGWTTAPAWTIGPQLAVELAEARDRGRLVLVARQDVPLEARRAHEARRHAVRERRGPAGAVRRGRADVRADELGGSSSPVQRWMSCRSTGSFESLAQTRSATSRMPRSVRAPPLEHDSISRPGCRGFSSAISRYTASVWRCAPGRPSCVDSTRSRLWSHLMKSTPSSPTSASIWPRTCAYASGFARSRTYWVRHESSGSWSRCPGSCSSHSGCARARSESRLTISGSNHRPNCMPSSCTRAASGTSPSGHTVAVDDPVAEARRVVAAALEPAVVEHEALDADLGRALGELQQPRRVVVEVDRLPRVEDERAEGTTDAAPARASRCGCARRGRRAPHWLHTNATGGAAYSSPGASTSSPGRSSSPAPMRVTASVTRSTRYVHVGRPGDVRGPQPAAAPQRRSLRGDGDGRSVVARAAASRLAHRRTRGHTGRDGSLLAGPACRRTWSACQSSSARAAWTRATRPRRARHPARRRGAVAARPRRLRRPRSRRGS